jgi:UDP-N-acetylmuramyl tripeptide synthase
MTKRNIVILIIAVLIVRFTSCLSRALKMGKGSNIPGKVALGLFPDLLKILVPRYQKGLILVTGTNGKTTTTKILVEILKGLGYSVTTNAQGANLMSGIVTSILLDPVRIKQEYVADYGIFEIDEAVLVRYFKLLHPRILVITNFSRDQLDRYGEVDSNIKRIIDLIQKSEYQCQVVLNGNDPNVARIASVIKPGNRILFGIKGDIASTDTGILFEKDTSAEIGQVLETIEFDLWGDSIKTNYLKGSHFRLGASNFSQENVEIKLPGVFNILNTLAALATGVLLGNNPQQMVTLLSEVTPSYGRSECFKYRGISVFLFLVKNPVGFNHIIHLLSQSQGEKRLLFLLNDLIADGKDVSWIWDVCLENLWKVPGIIETVTSGTRAGDMALRVKYSNPPPFGLTVDYSPRHAFKKLAGRLQPGEELLILANYTSMLKFRPYLLKLCSRNV